LEKQIEESPEEKEFRRLDKLAEETEKRWKERIKAVKPTEK